LRRITGHEWKEFSKKDDDILTFVMSKHGPIIVVYSSKLPITHPCMLVLIFIFLYVALVFFLEKGEASASASIDAYNLLLFYSSRVL
jgi:hypothetical protein